MRRLPNNEQPGNKKKASVSSSNFDRRHLPLSGMVPARPFLRILKIVLKLESYRFICGPFATHGKMLKSIRGVHHSLFKREIALRLQTERVQRSLEVSIF